MDNFASVTPLLHRLGRFRKYLTGRQKERSESGC